MDRKRKIKGLLITFVGVAAATAGTTVAAASVPAPKGRDPMRVEPAMERTLDYSETVPNLSASKFILTTDAEQAPTTAVNTASQAIQTTVSGRTVHGRDGEPSPLGEPTDRSASEMIAATVWIRAPTSATPAKTA